MNRLRNALGTLIKHALKKVWQAGTTSVEFLRRIIKSVIVDFPKSVWAWHPMASVDFSPHLRTTTLGFCANAFITVLSWVGWVSAAVAASSLPGPTHTFEILLDNRKICSSYRRLLYRHYELDRFWRRSRTVREQYPQLQAKLEE
ncbi:hypothetical protein BD769DRAFT_1391792, partial [Suillus cothurnatus]